MANKNYYLSIKDELIKIIERNKSKEIDTLPSENLLAVRLGFSRPTIRKALAELQNEGLIVTVKGRNTRICFQVKKPKFERLALIIPHQHGFSDLLIKNITKICHDKNIAVSVMLSLNNINVETDCLDSARKLKCDGLIIMPSDDSIYSKAFSQALPKIPTVFVDRNLPDQNLPFVSTNHFEMGFKAAEYLCRNHTDIAIISFPKTLSSSKERVNGYLDAIKKFQPNSKDYFIHLSHHYIIAKRDPLIERITRHLKENEKITAIISNSGDEFAIISLAASLSNRKFEFALFDNNNVELETINAVKCVRICQDSEQIAETVVNVLLEANANSKNEAKNIIIPPICHFHD